MGCYISRRILIALSVALIVIVVAMGIMSMAPREPAFHVLTKGFLTAEDYWELRAELHMDMSFHERYAAELADVLRGDFGRSWWTGRAVTAEVAARSRVSIGLVLIALPIVLTAIAARGVLEAVRPGSRLDRCSAWISRTGAATPEFVIAILGAYVLYALAGWAPQALTLIIGGVAAGWHVGARSAIDASLRWPDRRDHGYVLAARAKGLGDATIATRHVLPNVAVSTLRAAAGAFPLLLGSVLMVEVALELPGVGHLVLLGVLIRDYPVTEGVLLVTAMTVIASNLVVDVASAAMDPRIRNNEGVECRHKVVDR